MVEKAILAVQKNKEGKLRMRVTFENKNKRQKGSGMPAPPWCEVKQEFDNKPCEVKREQGQIVEMIVDGEKLTKPGIAKNKSSKPTGATSRAQTSQRQHQRSTGQSGSKKNTPIEVAKAPYNFIPLNKTVVTAKEDLTETYFDRYYSNDENLTGYIELQLETRTPLYTRGTGITDDKKNPDFFSPGGKLKIPGSSIRGMTRFLVEIVSWGKFSFFSNKTLYYRGLADTSSLRNEYQQNMSSGDKKTKQYHFKAGYLTKEGFKYYIIPAKTDNKDKTFIQVKQRNKNEKFVIEKQKDGKYLVISGSMPGKEQDWLLNSPDYKKPRISVLDQDINAYEQDENRYWDKKEKDDTKKKDGNLLRQLEISEENIVPCFYVCWQDAEGKDRVSFGHTGYFRLAYQKTIGEHVPEKLKDDEKIDMAEAIFGKETKFASRVFFEDAELISGQSDILMKEESPKILSGPKPTTFQHYLEQKEVKYVEHWNSEVDIRGYKLYWHRDTSNQNSQYYWGENEAKNTNQHTVIQPVKPGTKFKGRLRFENLLPEELGALLFVLDLPAECCHKLGMGKPLGLGSVKVTPTLIISNRKQRYQKLFSDNTWALAEDETGEIDNYKKQFAGYVLSQSRENVSELWATPRLKALKTMLDWSNTKKQNWLEETRYMELGKFKNRPVLPEPQQVIK